MKRLFLLTTFSIVATISVANENSANWTVSPFDQKVFVENKGQFDGKINSSKILFGTSVNGVDLYFSTIGVTYRHDEAVPRIEEKRAGNREQREEEGLMMKIKTEYLSIEWIGSNLEAEIITQDSVPFYYTYAGEAGTIMAHAYKKIMYKNLYPNIDIEYIFPEGKEGMKYTVIVHPGGDLARVKMRYTEAESLALDPAGNLMIKSSFGDFIDHAPVTTTEKLTIPSSFIVNDDEVSLSVNTYDTTKTLVVDPWMTNPNFAGYNSAYDVNYDLNGNVYIYGSHNPFKLTKLDSTGAVQWIFNATDLGFIAADTTQHLYIYVYGDFAVDEVSGTSYLVEGYGPINGSRIFKVNTLGVQTGTFPGDTNMREMWRAEYSRSINKILIGGGGTSSHYQAAMIDTNLVNISLADVFSTNQYAHDIALLVTDNNSPYCYMASAKARSSGDFDNIMIKCPIPNLVPVAFSVQDEYKFHELGSVTYINDSIQSYSSRANGMNGMAVSPNWLYTYDSDSLKRWDKKTGAFIVGIHASSRPAIYGGFSGSAIQISWGGVSVDECDNIYAGVAASIKEYNSSLSFISSIALPDTVYDIKVGLNNTLYACGKGFVASYSVGCDALCATPEMSRIAGKQPGEIFTVPLVLNHSSGIMYAQTIDLVVHYDDNLLRFVGEPHSVYGDVAVTQKKSGEIAFTVVVKKPLPSTTVEIADLEMEALLASYATGTIEVKTSRITLQSGNQVQGQNCPATFTLDSDCVMPHTLQRRAMVEIVGIYPNPSYRETRVSIVTKNTSRVQLEIYDVFGREIEMLHYGEISDGSHEVFINTEKYSAGIYFCRLIHDGHIITKAFNVER